MVCAPWLVYGTLESLAGLCVLLCEGPPLTPARVGAPNPPPASKPDGEVYTGLCFNNIVFTMDSFYTDRYERPRQDPSLWAQPPTTTITLSTDPGAAEGRPFPTGFFCLVFFSFWSFSFSRENSNSEKSGLGYSRLQPRPTV